MDRAWEIPGPVGGRASYDMGSTRILHGVDLRTTNNRMELAATINGLLLLTEKCRVTVITDSKYLQQGITLYFVRWHSRGWCDSRGEAIANRDLWERLASVAGRHVTTWRRVRGHI